MAIKWSALDSVPAAIAAADVGCIIQDGVSYKFTMTNLAAFVAANGITLAGVAGVLTATAPTQTTDTQAGVGWAITASDAVAGSSNAGAASGGSVTIVAGDAKRLTSGNSQGGSINLKCGLGVGSPAVPGYHNFQVDGAFSYTTLRISDDASAYFDQVLSVDGGSNQQTLSLQSYPGSGAALWLFWSTTTANQVGGDLWIMAGDGVGGNSAGGPVILLPGEGAGSGADGKVIVRQPGGSAGTDEGQLTHDGTYLNIVNPDASKVIRSSDGTTNCWLQNTAGRARVSTQFDSTSETLADITGLSVTVIAGRTYTFIARVWTSFGAGAVKYSVGGTCTATAIRWSSNLAWPTGDAQAYYNTAMRTALGTEDVYAGAISNTGWLDITGTITVNAGGTLTIQLARNTASGTTSALIGSYLIVEDMP
ncbi:hypothetical protein C4577_03675 [Candidatus Parcubacteria bacterium]|nr:MAG: hypothetical protein C4577_03675 [Candidatus Parcubacteria bacterium]